MSLPVLTGFVGVLVAAAATGMLAGRCARQPRIDFIVWTAATLGLTVALAAQSMGFASGFGPVTFRAVQLSALLLAPLWLAWGLIELAAANETVRFGTRLVASALTVVTSVILVTEPLTTQPFSKAWPASGPHFQMISHYALDAVQVVAVFAVVLSAGLAAARVRSDPRWRPVVTGVVPACLAALITVGLRFPLPAKSAYPLLTMVAAALVWFAAARLPDRRPGGRKGPAEAGRPAGDGRPGGYVPGGRHPAYGQRGPAVPVDPRDPRELRRPGGPGTPAPAAPAPAVAASARPYGRLLIFTLLDDKAADFDRLAERTAEEVRTGEPDTLVYVIHLVPNAPLQRIFYEIYRDRAAFDSHESKLYMQRFVAERRSCVLATNVIELRLKYAKVAPLPSPQQRPDQQRPDQQRPGKRQLPPTGRRPGGI